MLSEQTIERLTERLVERIESQNVQIIKQIGQSIIKLGQLSPSKAQQLVQILRYGGDYDKIIREIKRITKLNIKDIEQMFREVAKQDYQFAEQFYKYKNKKYIPFDENKQLQNQLKALTKVAVKDYYNLTNTSVIGFTVKDPIHNTIIFKDLQTTYVDALDQAVLSISQGKTTFQDELHQIVRTLGKSGLKIVNYESGKSMRLDSAVRMNMKDALRNLHNETQKIVGEQFDADGVEISVHENPAPDHAEVQGRQFSISEYNKLNEGLDAKDYNGIVYTLDHDHKNGYRPISTLNCYHYVFYIVLGVSKPEYSDEQLQKIIDNNNKGFTYKDKHYTNYEGTQIQRRMETEIRKLKDQHIFAKQTNDEETANKVQAKIRVLSKQYKQFSEISHLRVKKDRLRVSGYLRKNK